MWIRIRLLLVLNSQRRHACPSCTACSTSSLVSLETHSVVGMRRLESTGAATVALALGRLTRLNSSLSFFAFGGLTGEILATCRSSSEALPTTGEATLTRLILHICLGEEDLFPRVQLPSATFKADWLSFTALSFNPPVTFKTGGLVSQLRVGLLSVREHFPRPTQNL